MGGIENCFQQCDLVFRGAHHCLVCVDDVSPTARGDAKDTWMVGGGLGTAGCAPGVHARGVTGEQAGALGGDGGAYNGVGYTEAGG